MKKNGKPEVWKPVVEIYEVDQFEQGSEEWFKIRSGIPTASCFSMVMAHGKSGDESLTRKRYMRVLAGEILTGRPGEGSKKIITAAMQRGNDMEQEAFDHYVSRHFATVRRVGFMRRLLPSGRWVGASPDGLIDQHKGIELKTMQPDLLIERLEKGSGMPTEHMAQVQGEMWVGDLEEMDVMLFYSGMPVAPKFTVRRNETYIRDLSRAVEVFDFELHQLVAKIRSMG
jgi:YqaJ-like viral recombinase domain